MAQVSNQAELQAALHALDPLIQIGSGFALSSQININYSVTIEGSAKGSRIILTKDTSYASYLFCITDKGTLTLKNIILDGTKTVHPKENPKNRSLIHVSGGSLILHEGAVLQNNNAFQEGGGISADEKSQVSLQGGSIRGNTSGRLGGGIWNHGESILTITSGTISHNKAPCGCGIYNASVLLLDGECRITDSICLENRFSVVCLSHALAGVFRIQLERSSYVEPNPEGIPIVVGEATHAYPLLSRMDANAFQKPSNGFADWEVQLSEGHTQILLLPAYLTLFFEGNEHDLTRAVHIPDPIHVPGGESLIIPHIVPKRKGYIFKQWNTSSNGSGISYLPGETIPVILGNTILYAVWKEKHPFLSHRTKA